MKIKTSEFINQICGLSGKGLVVMINITKIIKLTEKRIFGLGMINFGGEN